MLLSLTERDFRIDAEYKKIFLIACLFVLLYWKPSTKVKFKAESNHNSKVEVNIFIFLIELPALVHTHIRKVTFLYFHHIVDFVVYLFTSLYTWLFPHFPTAGFCCCLLLPPLPLILFKPSYFKCNKYYILGIYYFRLFFWSYNMQQEGS